MKTKIIQFIPTLIALAVIGFRYFSSWCIFANGVCYGTFVSHISLTVTKPLYFFALYSLPITIILAFVPRGVFNSWLKFAVWAIPLLLILVATQPVYATHILSTDRNDAARLAGEVFVAASLILFVWKYYGHRKSI